MLVRGALCRLAADVPKTSTHDLPHLPQLLRSSLFVRNGTSSPAVRTLSRAYQADILQPRRSFATATTPATKPTVKVKRDVKKAAAKKPAKKPAKKKAAKKAAAKAPAKKTVAKKKAAKEADAKPTRAKKVRTPEEQLALDIKEHKKLALRLPVSTHRMGAFNIFVGEQASRSGSLESAQKIMIESAAKYKTLTPAEQEHYNHLANERNAANHAELQAWVHSHTPEQIRLANLARAWLRRNIPPKGRLSRQSSQPIPDDRAPKKAVTAYVQFVTERYESGDLKGISACEAIKLIASEWKALSDYEKKKYEDATANERERYHREADSIYGRTPPSSPIA